MEQPENYYGVLGVTKASTDADIRQAHSILVQSLHSKAQTLTPELAAQRKQLLDLALQTLLTPEKRKRHDEKLDWYVAKSRIAAERARDAATQLKEAQEAALELQKAALAAEKKAANDAARRVEEEARRISELARVEAEAAERFRQLREERSPFLDTVIPSDRNAEVATQAAALTQQEPDQAGESSRYMQSLVKKATLAGIVLVALVGLTFVLLRQSAPKPLPAAVPPAPTAQADSVPAQAAVPPEPACGATPATPCPAPAGRPDMAAPPEPQQAAASAVQPPAQTALPRPAKVDSAKTAEQLQYQKVLRRVEEEHPELNPDRAGHRNDLIAYVAARLNVHVKEGYPRSKALDIAVRDLETQEQAKRMLEKFRSSKETPPPEAAPVLDKGEHQGYDPKCRWVTPEQWSCK